MFHVLTRIPVVRVIVRPGIARIVLSIHDRHTTSPARPLVSNTGTFVFSHPMSLRVTVDIVRTSVIPLRVESTLWLKRPVHVQHTVTHRWLPQSVHVLN